MAQRSNALACGFGAHFIRVIRARCSLAEPVGSLRQHPQAIEPFAGGDIKRSLVRSGERHVRALARRSDLAEILAGGIEDLNTRDSRDVDPILAIERHAIRAALLAGGDVL